MQQCPGTVEPAKQAEKNNWNAGLCECNTQKGYSCSEPPRLIYPRCKWRNQSCRQSNYPLSGSSQNASQLNPVHMETQSVRGRLLRMYQFKTMNSVVSCLQSEIAKGDSLCSTR